jgi:hypothetical protein
MKNSTNIQKSLKPFLACLWNKEKLSDEKKEKKNLMTL